MHPRPKFNKPPPSTQAINWWQVGQDILNYRLSLVPVTSVAKNVIIFIGDGMGVATEAAARFLVAQRKGVHPIDGKFSWDDLPYTGVARVKIYIILV